MRLSPKRYRPGWNWPLARELFRHGLPIAGTTLLSFGLLNVDYLVVGNILGAVALGLYVFAFNLSSFPVTVLINALRRVSLAGFSRLHQEGGLLRSTFTRAFALTVAAVVPICALLVGFAPDLIHFIYGSKWDGAIDVLRLLAVVGGIRAIVDLSSDLFTAIGKARWTLTIHVMWLVMLIPTLIAGAHLAGIEGVGAGHLLVAVVFVLPVYLYALHRAGMAVGELARESVRPLIGGVLLGIVALAVSQLIDGAFGTLAIGGILSTIAYLAIVAPMRRLVRTPDADPASETS
jgi:PST family polysaccharide transporter